MQLGDFKDLLRSSIKRGTSYDDQLGGFARRAARWIEQNHTLQYMRRRFQLSAVVGTDEIDLPANVPVKSVEFIRFDGTDGYPLVASKAELSDTTTVWVPRLQGGTSRDWPTRYYMDGTDKLIFNRAFPEALTGQGILARYSDWPKNDNQTHWLLINAEGLLLRQAMIEFFVHARDDRGYAVTLAQRDQDIKALMNADYEARYAGQDIVVSS